MTFIVADSGPLIMFARSGLLDIVRSVCGTLLVPVTVFEECTCDAAKPGVRELLDAQAAGLFEVVSVSEPDMCLPDIIHLDGGEIEALVLAFNRRCPVLMDESLGRKAAMRHGIGVVGGAGLLLAAKERGLIDAVFPILHSWRQWGYFLAPALLRAVLERAGEHGQI